VFIELTDILRCPVNHDEQYLVLVPDSMTDRSVQSGMLGCPVCLREYPVLKGTIHFADPPFRASSAPPELDASALVAFLGLSGPGGYVGLVGDAVRYGPDLIAAVPGVHFVGINGPAETTELPMMSILAAETIPIRSRSLRGVILSAPFAGNPGWQREALRSVLPGLRVAGQGTAPDQGDLVVLAEAGGRWVAQRR
jgi:uncharacterized protein YbaR (Trm112 family)